MALLERDTDGPLMKEEPAAATAALIQTHEEAGEAQEQEQQQQEQTSDGALVESESHSESEQQVDQEATTEQETEVEAGTENENEQHAESETEAHTEAEQQVEAEAAAEAEAEAEQKQSDADLMAAMPALMEMAATARAQARWRNAPPRRHPRRHSIRADRERIARKAHEDAVYAENLRKLAVRRAKWSVPVGGALPATVNKVAHMNVPRDADGMMTNEEAQVESLLQINSKPMITLRHTNDVKGKLTFNLLHGTGLNNEENRKATLAGLRASKDNHPPAPAFVPLAPNVGRSQPREVSFVAQHEVTRPMYAGPATADLPRENVPAPTVLRSRVPAPVPAAVPSHKQSDSVSEEEFVAGLPKAFMELDAATQVQILALADAGVGNEKTTNTKANTEKVDAKGKAETKAKQTKTAAKVKAQTESKATATVTTAAQTKTNAAAKTSTKANASADGEGEVNESELAAAASTLNALAALQKESHVPFAKLVHLLAQRK